MEHLGYTPGTLVLGVQQAVTGKQAVVSTVKKRKLSEPQHISNESELNWLKEGLHKNALLHNDRDLTNSQTIFMQTIFFWSNIAKSSVPLKVVK